MSELFYFLRRHAVDLLRYLPPFLAKDSTFKVAQDTLSREHESLRLRLVDLARQFFIEHATWSMADWETFTGVRKLSDDLEARRARVKAKLMGGEVMTVANTNRLIRSFTLEDTAHVVETATPNVLRVVLPEIVPYWREMVDAMLELMPAHLLWDYEQRISDTQLAHVGTAQAWLGNIEIGLNKPDELSIFPTRAGMAHAIIGEATISMQPPDILFGNVHRLHAGQALGFGGEIIIKADPRDMPDWRLKIHENPLADLLIADVGLARGGELKLPVATFEETHKTQVFTGAGLLVDGAITIGLPQVPKKTRVRGHVGIGHALTGEVVIKTEPKINLRTWTNPRIGQAVVVAGEIVVGSETKPVPVPDVHVFSITDRLRPFAGIGMHIGGSCDIGLAPQIFHNRAAAPTFAGGLIIIEGEIIIKPTTEPWPDPADFMDGDWLRLYFDYPTGRDHPVLLQNPRGDIYVADIKAVGDFADKNNLFLNSRAEDTISIHRADLIRGFNIAEADDNATLPAADTLRLFFDFATGNKRRIMLHNVRPGITAGELRAIGEDAVGLLKNAYAQTTSGISHVALIKHYKISAANGDTLITF